MPKLIIAQNKDRIQQFFSYNHNLRTEPNPTQQILLSPDLVGAVSQPHRAIGKTMHFSYFFLEEYAKIN